MLELAWMVATILLIVKFPAMPFLVKLILYFNLLPQTYILLVKANRKLEERRMEQEFMRTATAVDPEYMPEQEDMDRVFDALEQQRQADKQVEARLIHMYGARVGAVVYQRWLASGRQQKFDDVEGMAK